MLVLLEALAFALVLVAAVGRRVVFALALAFALVFAFVVAFAVAVVVGTNAFVLTLERHVSMSPLMVCLKVTFVFQCVARLYCICLLGML